MVHCCSFSSDYVFDTSELLPGGSKRRLASGEQSGVVEDALLFTHCSKAVASMVMSIVRGIYRVVCPARQMRTEWTVSEGVRVRVKGERRDG